MTHSIYATLELPLGLADLRAPANVCVTLIDSPLLASLARLDTPLHENRFELQHAIEGRDSLDGNPVLRACRMESPHEPAG